MKTTEGGKFIMIHMNGGQPCIFPPNAAFGDNMCELFLLNDTKLPINSVTANADSAQVSEKLGGD